MILHNLKKILSTVLIIGMFVLGANVIYSWTTPPASPPSSDAPAPINVGPSTQVKSGSLGIDGNFLVSGNAVFTGKVKIMDGTQSAGRYLTSDANGYASWKLLP